MGPRLRFMGCFVLLLAGGLTAEAGEEVLPSWTGLGTDANWTSAGNWLNGIAPLNDGTATPEISPSPAGKIVINVSQNLGSLILLSNNDDRIEHHFSATGASTLTLNSGLNFGGTRLNTSGHAVLDSSLGLVLAANQNWSVASGGSLQVAGPVSGSGQLSLTNGGEVVLNGSNSYTGGTVLNQGALGLASDTALGGGTLTISSTSEGTPQLLVIGGDRTIANPIALDSAISISTERGSLTFTGETTLGGNVSVSISEGGDPVFFDGKIQGAHRLSISGGSAVVLSGANTYSGGTTAISGGAIFRDVLAIPASGFLTADTNGYVGLGTPPSTASDLQSLFIDRFDKGASVGTIGFDTDSEISSTPNDFSGAIDLTGFTQWTRLGTSTEAKLSGTITPVAGAGYQFGGGGGGLIVASPLTGLNQVFVESTAEAPMTLHLTSASNSYTGATTAINSAIVFGAGALPITTLHLSDSVASGTGYIGTKDQILLLSSYLGKFDSFTDRGIIGFDSDNPLSPYVVGAGGATPIAIDLSGFTVASPEIFLGTASGARLAGPILLPVNQADYRFAGYKGGRLEVESELTGTRKVIIGDGTHATSGGETDIDGDGFDDISAVFLNNSANTYSGGTELRSGRLGVGQVGSLGSGSLDVYGPNSSVEREVVLESINSTPITIGNNINLFTSLLLGGVNPFTLSGTIAGSEGLMVVGNAEITLLGANTFTGGLSINNGNTVVLGHNNAVGTGGLSFEFSGGTATFTNDALNPTIGWLKSELTNAIVNLPSTGTLTINQSLETNFDGVIAGTGANIVKSGIGEVFLGGISPNTYSGNTTISQGTLVAGKAGAFGTGTVTVHNGALLGVDKNITVTNPLVLNDGARVAGYGTLSPGGTLEIKGGTTLAPGGLGPFDQIGTLSIADTALSLAAGGRYNFEVQDAIGVAGQGYDLISISTALSISATSSSPFVIGVFSVDPTTGEAGQAGRFDPGYNYFWTIAQAGSITGFDPAAFAIDTSGFVNSLNGGTFKLLQSGNDLVLQFAPVPEPSTWALIVVGLGAVVVTTLRRRRK